MIFLTVVAEKLDDCHSGDLMDGSWPCPYYIFVSLKKIEIKIHSKTGIDYCLIISFILKGRDEEALSSSHFAAISTIHTIDFDTNIWE